MRHSAAASKRAPSALRRLEPPAPRLLLKQASDEDHEQALHRVLPAWFGCGLLVSQNVVSVAPACLTMPLHVNLAGERVAGAAEHGAPLPSPDTVQASTGWAGCEV